MSTTEGRAGSPRRRLGDLVFSGTARAAGLVILLALAGVAIFLTVKGLPALGAGRSDLNGAANFWAYVAPLVFGTLAAVIFNAAGVFVSVPFTKEMV